MWFPAGLAVITVMLVTTCLTSLVIILYWNKPLFLALAFLIFFGSIECFYLSASLIKFREGAWVPILLSFLLMTVMFLWHYATILKYQFDLQNKVSLDWLLALGESLGIARVPGIGLVYTDLISGVPSNFSHFITNLPAFHRVLVFVCIKYIPVPFVPAAERYLVGRVGPPDHRSYRCIVRYGYQDVHQDIDSFESELVASLADFIKLEASYPVDNDVGDGYSGLTVVGRTSSFLVGSSNEIEEAPTTNTLLRSSTEGNGTQFGCMGKPKKVRFFIEDERSARMDQRVREELHELQEACESGTAFILGHSHVRTKPGSSIIKKLAIEVGYNFLKRNCRGPDVALRVPPASLLEVGMVYVL